MPRLIPKREPKRELTQYEKERASYEEWKKAAAENPKGLQYRLDPPWLTGAREDPSTIPDEDAAIAANKMVLDCRTVEKGDRLRRSDPFVLKYKHLFHKPQPPPEPLD